MREFKSKNNFSINCYTERPSNEEDSKNFTIQTIEIKKGDVIRIPDDEVFYEPVCLGVVCCEFTAFSVERKGIKLERFLADGQFDALIDRLGCNFKEEKFLSIDDLEILREEIWELRDENCKLRQQLKKKSWWQFWK